EMPSLQGADGAQRGASADAEISRNGVSGRPRIASALVQFVGDIFPDQFAGSRQRLVAPDCIGKPAFKVARDLVGSIAHDLLAISSSAGPSGPPARPCASRIRRRTKSSDTLKMGSIQATIGEL